MWAKIFKAKYQFNTYTKDFDDGKKLSSCQGKAIKLGLNML